MRLNKFLARSGVASRRRSDELIKMAMATVINKIILDPAYKVKKSEKIIDTTKLKRINRGLSIGEGEIGRAKVISQVLVKGRCKARLELKQGKKREIKRIFRSLKIKLFSLHRVSYGGVKIGNLKEGEYRYLNENEINSLKRKF